MAAWADNDGNGWPYPDLSTEKSILNIADKGMAMPELFPVLVCTGDEVIGNPLLLQEFGSD